MQELSEDLRLADGSEPARPADLFRRLDELGIAVRTREHEPVFTVEQARALRGEIPGCHSKNLFLRDKKGGLWLVVCRESLPIEMKALAGVLGAARLSFGSARRLGEHLGVIPGAVTPFAVLNDRQRAVHVAIDRGMLGESPWNFHPLDNARTTSILPEDLVRFLRAEGHEPRIVDLDG